VLVIILAWIFVNDRNRFARQTFEFPGAQISLSELDVIDAGARSFGNFGKQIAATRSFVAWKLAPVSNVIEQARVCHGCSAD
jgi:hypothetical protein